MELDGELTLPGSAQEAPIEAEQISVPRERPVLRVSSPGRLLMVSLALGLAVDLLFYGKPLGISVLFFVLLVMGALFTVGIVEGVRPRLGNLWLVLPILFFAGMIAVRANAFLTFLNLCAVMVLLALLGYFYAGGRVERMGLFGYPIVLLIAASNAVGQTPFLMSASANTGRARRAGMPRLAPVMRGLFIALPVLLVFIALMASADLVFARFVQDAFKLDFIPNLGEWLWRLLIILTAAWLAAGGIYYALSRKAAAEVEVEPGIVPSARAIGATEAATVLVLVDLLFMVFVWIQFAYLFAGHSLASLEDSSYKNYARRGFGELIAVSVLTLGLILILRWLARHDTAAQVRIFNGLSTLLVGLALVVLASAWLRMVNWEEIADYIYTDKRLYVRVFIVWLGLLFLWSLVSLWWRPSLFAIGAFVAALGFLVTLNVMNPEADVVQFNVSRASVRELYVPYLDRLSEDAVPGLMQGLNQVPEPARSELRNGLRLRLDAMQKDTNWQSWQSYNIARWQAYAALSKNLK